MLRKKVQAYLNDNPRVESQRLGNWNEGSSGVTVVSLKERLVMAGYIPDDIVERIKAESDIVSVVSAFVNLKRSGKDYKGLCPFHQEKTPSFYVIPSKGFYHCFGCGAGGNSVNFIMAHERLDYPDSLRYLAAKAGITIPETEAKKSQSEALFEALSLAGMYFSNSLANPEVGGGAMAYLKSRGIGDETIKLFGMGYAPHGWDGLLKLAASKNIQAVILERVGLAIKKEGYYDRFRHRLMVPIRTLSGRFEVAWRLSARRQIPGVIRSRFSGTRINVLPPSA